MPKTFCELSPARRERILNELCAARDRYPTPYTSTQAETQYLMQLGRYICGSPHLSVTAFREWWQSDQAALWAGSQV